MNFKKRLDKLEKYYCIDSDTCFHCGRIKGDLPLGFLPDVDKAKAEQSNCPKCNAMPQTYFYDVNTKSMLAQLLRKRLNITPDKEKEFREEYRFLFFEENKEAERERRQRKYFANEPDDDGLIPGINSFSI